MVFDFLKDRRRARLREEPFPAEWEAVLDRGVPIYRRLPDEEKEALRGHVQVFLAEKQFEGAGGLEMTDEIRVIIAAQACLLLLRLDDAADYYPRLRSIVVYPSTYVAKAQEGDGAVVHEGDSVRLGESWTHGAVVLSWDGVRAGAANPRDGHNVVLHEFAHQLDQEDGGADGTPEMPWSRYAPWARVLSEHYLELRRDARRGRRTVLDDYGALNEAEFFAVATETFFEKPGQLQRRHPELYEELKAYYGQDPAATLQAPAEGGGES